MNFKECLEKGLIKKDKDAPGRVKNSLDIAERFLRASRKNIDISELEMSEIASYNAIFHSARSLLFKQGYIERSHFCVILALKEFYKGNDSLLSQLNTFDKIRVSRHNIQYGGVQIDREEAEFVLDFARQFFKTAKQLITKK